MTVCQGMKNAFLLSAISVILVMIFSCSKKEQDVKPLVKNPEYVKPKGQKMFIGVHARTVSYPSVYDLIVGFTNTDSSFTQTDSIRGAFQISSNMDKHSSARSRSKQELYFIYRHAGNGRLHLGIVNSENGKFTKSLDLGIQQMDMIHLQYDEIGGKLYFSMGPDLYQVNTSDGSLSSIKQGQYTPELPADYPSGASYLSHLIRTDNFMYVKDDTHLMYLDKLSLKWDSILLNYEGSYRSLIVSPADKDIFYSYNLGSNMVYNLVRINLKDKTIKSTVTQNSNCHILWFQAQFHPVAKLYTCLPFDHQLFPYFITINVETGKTVNYPSPSHLGQCLLD